MRFQQLLDSMSIVAVFLAFAVGALLVSEGGFRVGRWWQDRTPEEKEGPTNMIVGSLLALLAFLLAVSMGMAADRFDARRGLVLAEANALGTTYLRAGYLPEPASSRIRGLLREYLPLRILRTDVSGTRDRIVRCVELHAELWSITEDLARTSPESDTLALFIESLNQVIDLHESRVTVGIYGRVPETVIVLLFLSSMLTLGMVGYNAGLTRRRSPLTAVVMIVVLGAVLALVVDLDRSREGFLTVNEQPLIDLLQPFGAPPAPADPSD